MKSREDVIKGLECCIEYDYKCKFCPYADDGGAEDCCYSDELKTDALALLKAQEPRVMTLEEVRKTPYTTPIYCEWREGEVHTALISPKKNMRLEGFVEMYTDDEEVGLLNYEVHIMESYGKTWRCWTSKPDKTTREATPWD